MSQYEKIIALGYQLYNWVMTHKISVQVEGLPFVMRQQLEITYKMYRQE